MKKVILSLLSVCALVMFISCGSKPTEEGTLPEAPAVEDTVETFVPPVEVFDNEATIALIAKAMIVVIPFTFIRLHILRWHLRRWRWHAAK